MSSSVLPSGREGEEVTELTPLLLSSLLLLLLGANRPGSCARSAVSNSGLSKIFSTCCEIGVVADVERERTS